MLITTRPLWHRRWYHCRFQSCSHSPPLSVSVKWETEGSAGSGSPLIDGDGAEGPAGRREALVLVGIHTGFESAGRGRALWWTWFPSDRAALQRYVKVISQKRRSRIMILCLNHLILCISPIPGVLALLPKIRVKNNCSCTELP